MTESIPSDIYPVKVGDKTFRLSLSQIERDRPNYFTLHFFDSSGQRRVQELEVLRDPYIFALVVRYLNGYQIAPIHPNLIPRHCTLETAMADLRADAKFYQLNGLLNLCFPKKISSEELRPPHNTLALHSPGPVDSAQLSTCYAAVTGYIRVLSEKHSFMLGEDFELYIPRFSMVILSDVHFEASSTGMFTLAEKWLVEESPHNVTVASWSERIVRAVLRRDTNCVERWELLGWKKAMVGDIRNAAIFIKLWVGPGFSMKD